MHAFGAWPARPHAFSYSYSIQRRLVIGSDLFSLGVIKNGCKELPLQKVCYCDKRCLQEKEVVVDVVHQTELLGNFSENIRRDCLKNQ